MSHNNCPLDQIIGFESSICQPDFLTTPIFDGKYHQPCEAVERTKHINVVKAKIESGHPEDITITEFQRWVELDWLTPHGTFETANRLGRNMWEEAAKEYPEEIGALESVASAAESQKDTSASKLELGDSLWNFMASASNDGIDLESTLAAKFKIAKPVTFGGVQALVTDNPFWLPLWIDMDLENIGTIRSDTDGLEPGPLLSIYAYEAYRLSILLYGNGNRKPSEAPKHLFVKAADWYADVILLLAYYAKHWSRTDLPNIAAINFIKLTNRVETNQIDKNAGPRF